ELAQEQPKFHAFLTLWADCLPNEIKDDLLDTILCYRLTYRLYEPRIDEIELDPEQALGRNQQVLEQFRRKDRHGYHIERYIRDMKKDKAVQIAWRFALRNWMDLSEDANWFGMMVFRVLRSMLDAHRVARGLLKAQAPF